MLQRGPAIVDPLLAAWQAMVAAWQAMVAAWLAMVAAGQAMVAAWQARYPRSGTMGCNVLHRDLIQRMPDVGIGRLAENCYQFEQASSVVTCFSRESLYVRPNILSVKLNSSRDFTSRHVDDNFIQCSVR